MISHTLSDNYILQNRYHIIRLIGQGGFGLTYLATDTELNKKVCIKELFIDGINQRTAETVTLTQGKTNFPWQHFIANFKKEAQKIAEFKHPNIVSVSSVFEANGTVYYVMDYVEGETLKDRLKTMGRPFNPEELKPIAAQIFDAVETVHQKGLLHRDIKPDNILITADDEIVLIDFGSARENMDERTVVLLSATTMIFLTHGYAAPEMYSNTVLKGKYTDIYSLGATFYFLLTAVKPSAANDLILGAKMPSVHELNPNVSTQISSVIGLAIQIKPEDRFQKVGDMRAAMDEINSNKLKQKVKSNIEIKKISKNNELRIRLRFTLAVICLALLIFFGFTIFNSTFYSNQNKPIISNTEIVQEEEEYLDNLYALVNKHDLSFKYSLSLDQFKKRMLDPDYAGRLTDWVKEKDPSFEPQTRQSTEVSKKKDINTKTEIKTKPIPYETSNFNFEMVPVAGGTFTMGCTAEQGGECEDIENPAHQVSLSSFQIGKYEVTQAQWKAVMGNNPSYYKNCPNCPVEFVSWNDIQQFISRLNAKTGKKYRLPTEAEWEYAARGGNRSRGYKYSGSNNFDEVAWSEANSNNETHPVGGKRPNELGIYDMSGNVWEWCNDWYGQYSSVTQINPKGATSGSNRVLRGGSWGDDTQSCRVSLRSGGSLGLSYVIYGFRLVLVP